MKPCAKFPRNVVFREISTACSSSNGGLNVRHAVVVNLIPEAERDAAACALKVSPMIAGYTLPLFPELGKLS